MSRLSLKLQAKSLKKMALRKPYLKKLGDFEYWVLPRVYKGSTDTELFCKILKIKQGQSVWDIGTGAGLIAFHAKKMGAGHVLATDLNPDAVKNARENSKLLGLSVEVKRSNVFGGIKKKFDIITFNPPFTDNQAKQSHEISFWDKGHATLRKFFEGLPDHLTPRGKGMIAWSSFGNIRKLKIIAKDYNFTLKEIARKRGKRNFTYYIFEIDS